MLFNLLSPMKTYVSLAAMTGNCILPTQCICRFRVILSINSVNQLIFVMVKCNVFFAVRTELLSGI
jgi:hypothetical protein